jgi:hypothetical protein
MLAACRLAGLSALVSIYATATSARNHHYSSVMYGAREETEMRPHLFQ